MGNTKGISLTATSFVILIGGCSGGGGGEDSGIAGDSSSFTSSHDLHHFDTTREVPTQSKALEQSANSSLLRAIQYQVFESEFDSEYQAPHLEAWGSLNLDNYLEGSPYRKTYSCQEFADYLNEGQASSGQGTYTLVSTLEQDLTGGVEIIYNDCVINGRARSGSRKMTVLESPEYGYYYSGDPSPHFRMDYNNYYWGTQGLTTYLDGSVTYRQNPDEDHYKSFTTVSNFKLIDKGASSIEAQEITTLCTDDYFNDVNIDAGWGCEIESGDVAISGFGQYKVKSMVPFHRTLWAWGAKTEFSDDQGNRFIYWADEGLKQLTWVTPSDSESTHAVEYNSSSFDLIEGESSQINAELAITELSTEFEQWDKKLYAYQADEFILLKSSGSSKVDTIRSSDLRKRSIDLIDPAYDVQVNVVGDNLYSGHDGAVRSIYLTAPDYVDFESLTDKYEVGLGKIVEVLGYNTIGYVEPGDSLDRINRVSYAWDSVNNRVGEIRNLGSGADYFESQNQNYAFTSYDTVYFGNKQKDDFQFKSVATGDNYDYLKFFKNELVLAGSGVLIRCTTTCVESATYWKSLDEAITAKYPTAGKQVFVAAGTDTEFTYGVDNNASLMIFSTVPVADLPNPYSEEAPGFGTKLWAIDLNDTRRLTELKLPVNTFSSPGVGFNIHHLAKSLNGALFVGSGRWNLHSDRDNTVFFTIDPAKISFE